MASAVPFDRETLLDLVVNAIPLGIMLFFIAVFLLANPFGSDPVGTAIQLTIVGVTFVALFVLTYVSGKAISESERELEEMEHAAVSEAVGAEGAVESEAGEPEARAAAELDAGPEAESSEDAPEEDGGESGRETSGADA